MLTPGLSQHLIDCRWKKKLGVFELGLQNGIGVFELEREDDRNLIGGTAARPARSAGRVAVTKRDQREGRSKQAV